MHLVQELVRHTVYPELPCYLETVDSPKPVKWEGECRMGTKTSKPSSLAGNQYGHCPWESGNRYGYTSPLGWISNPKLSFELPNVLHWRKYSNFSKVSPLFQPTNFAFWQGDIMKRISPVPPPSNVVNTGSRTIAESCLLFLLLIMAVVRENKRTNSTHPGTSSPKKGGGSPRKTGNISPQKQNAGQTRCAVAV